MDGRTSWECLDYGGKSKCLGKPLASLVSSVERGKKCSSERWQEAGRTVWFTPAFSKLLKSVIKGLLERKPGSFGCIDVFWFLSWCQLSVYTHSTIAGLSSFFLLASTLLVSLRLSPQLFMSRTWNRLQYLIKAWSLIWVAWEVHFIFISHQRLMEEWGGYPLCDC